MVYLMSNTIPCSICSRIPPEENLEKHHLIPKSKKGKETIDVCSPCGDQLHQLFTNKEMETTYNTLESLLSSEKVQTWSKWISKKPQDFSVCMKKKRRNR